MMIVDEEDAELILLSIFSGIKLEEDKHKYLDRYDTIINRILSNYPNLKTTVKRHLNELTILIIWTYYYVIS